LLRRYQSRAQVLTCSSPNWTPRILNNIFHDLINSKNPGKQYWN
jgi:hypothetical protein